ncbi:hypothetical protein [Sulfurimonas autotrophica]|uniref:DUF3078 domain-containing protein n=1 Tax=Sulfurimonas autotrophica (strain ATCC BAA-671 / DSM 16294 / JCM 11897 / OK10) TaxID=563040 RepID=E0USD1_SULAO|nr:hypothetical protein [Sulfurimonas autotrophica]ADN09094.1 conserved hypothetical protein [Sulfurimonas autotrophica DSM 16294]
MKLILLLCCLYLFNLYAEDVDTNSSYIDTTHKIISNKVTDYSSTLDQGINTLFTDKNAQNKRDNSKNSTNAIDNFFKNEKYINETDESFVSVNFNTKFQSKYGHTNTMSVNAHIALKRTNKKLNLFIKSVNESNTNTNIEGNKDSHTEVGMEYFRADYYKIQSKYSIGIRRLYPFIRARYFKKFTTGNWEIEPMQIFEYSTKDDFKEATYLYFDRTLMDKALFRIALHRETRTKLTGMDYDISAQYYWNFNKKTALNISEIFSGNTKYKMNLSSQEYSGINNYTTVVNFRKNVWKKWFFYEISPSLNFHKENDYQANYAITFLINIYFGNFGNKL